MQTPDTLRMFGRAAELAEKYQWFEEADALVNGRIPTGFGHEVGTAIADFKRDFPFGRRDPQRDDEIAKELAELRLLIARLRHAKLILSYVQGTPQ
jgi:hypothetical protein